MTKFIVEIDLGDDTANNNFVVAEVLDRVSKSVIRDGIMDYVIINDKKDNVIGHYEVAE